MADWNGFKKNGTTYIPNDATARAGVIANTKLIKDTVGWSGKNVFPIKFSEVKATNTSGTWNGNTYTINGGTVAFTVDNNGYVTGFTVNGTFSADSSMGMNAFDNNKQVPKDGSYILNGVNGGSASTYSLKMNYKPSASGSETGLVDVYNGDSTPKTINSAWLLKIYLILKAGTYSNKTINPMLRDANILDDTYEPYFGSTAFPRSEQAVLGAKNLLKPDFKTGTFLNVAVTNSDGVLNLNGTADSTNAVALTNRTLSAPYVYLPKGRYIFSASPIADVQVGTTYNGSFVSFAHTTTEGFVEFEITDSTQSDYKTADGSVLVAFYIGFTNTTVYNNVKVYPMLRLATDTDPTYAPYAMTNRELTDLFTITEGEFTNIVEGATVTAGLGNKITKFGKVVMAQLSLANVTIDAWNNICQVPTAFRPKSNIKVKDLTTSIIYNVERSSNIANIMPNGEISGGAVGFVATWITE